MLLFFITGGGMTPEQEAQLRLDIDRIWHQQLAPLQFTMVFAKYTDNVVALIATVQPSGPVTLIGHSFGGWTAAQTSHVMSDAGRKVAHLMMLDPVNNVGDEWSKPQPPLQCPPAIEVVDEYRGATESPWSMQLKDPGHYLNVLLPGGPNSGLAVHHPDSVWSQVTYQYIRQVLQGGSFIPQPPPPIVNATPIIDTAGHVWNVNPAGILVKAPLDTLAIM